MTLGAIGALLGLAGFFVTTGSGKWVDRWRNRVLLLERNVVDRQYRCYSTVEDIHSEPSSWNRMLLRSPGGATACVPLVFFVGWTVMTALVATQLTSMSRTHVPDVVNKPVGVAIKRLDQARLGIGKVERVRSPDPFGTVIAEWPIAEKPVAKGTLITLVVSDGQK